MFLRWSAAALLLLLMGLMPARATAQAGADRQNGSAPARYHLVAELPLVPGSKVGSRRAGLACLPHGSVRVDDFLSGADDLLFPLQRELARRGGVIDVSVVPPVGLSQLVVRLEDIDASLCATSWALGDKGRLKGKVAFTFSWSLSPPLDDHRNAPALQRREEIVISTRDHDTKLRTSEFLPLALVQLSERIAPPPG